MDICLQQSYKLYFLNVKNKQVIDKLQLCMFWWIAKSIQSSDCLQFDKSNEMWYLFRPIGPLCIYNYESQKLPELI